MKVADSKFPLGQLVITSNAQLELVNEDVMTALERHMRCDWGDLSDHDRAMNDGAVRSGADRILSSYKDSKGTKFWIITEADRSVTTVLLPDDY